MVEKDEERWQRRIVELESALAELRGAREAIRALPEKLAHDVVAPINSEALMPAKIVHTNEIRVRLSSEYVVKTTAANALAILGRKEESLETQLADARREAARARSSLTFLSQLLGGPADTEDIVDITEPYHSDDDEHATAAPAVSDVRAEDPRSSAELFRRLDELERLERTSTSVASTSTDDTHEAHQQPSPAPTTPATTETRLPSDGTARTAARTSSSSRARDRDRGATRTDAPRSAAAFAGLRKGFLSPAHSTTAAPAAPSRTVPAWGSGVSAVGGVVERAAAPLQEPQSTSAQRARPLSRFKQIRQKIPQNT